MPSIITLLVLVGISTALDTPYQYQTWQNYPVGNIFYNQMPQDPVATHSMMADRLPTRNTRIQTTTQMTTTTIDPRKCSDTRDVGETCSTAPSKLMFYYDKNTGRCQPFMYRGCYGNENKWERKLECDSACVGRALEAGVEDISPLIGACSPRYEISGLNATRCNHGECPSGHTCSRDYCCPTAKYLCSLQYSSGNFVEGGEKSDRYFWTDKFHTCMRFSYYGYGGNPNNFKDYKSCMAVCGQ